MDTCLVYGTQTMKQTYVYWLRHVDHVNPAVEGYIGITNNFERRRKEHFSDVRRNKKNLHVYNAMKYHGISNVVMEILCVCASRKVAGDVEEAFRPHKGIGWNMTVGGDEPLVDRAVEIVLYHRDNPDELVRYASITAAEEALGYKAGRLDMQKQRGTAVYNTDGWAILFEANFDRSKTLTPEERKKAGNALISGSRKGHTSVFKGMTDRWTDEQREAIGAAHRGKTISPEHLERIREAGRRNVTCKQITLSKGGVERTFHSISEASRQLGIPLSRLKSRVRRKATTGGADGWVIVKLGVE